VKAVSGVVKVLRGIEKSAKKNWNRMLKSCLDQWGLKFTMDEVNFDCQKHISDN
jgi:hypothetical protein